MLFRRSFKSFLRCWPDLAIALALLYYVDIRWFYAYCFVEWLICHSAWNDHRRSQMRVYQIGNECKLLAIMEKLGVTIEDAERMFNTNVRDKMDDTAYEHLQGDYKIVGI
jgi:hypothetical protein